MLKSGKKWVEGIPEKDLNKAILSGHPAKGVALLIEEKGSFKPSDYKDEKNVHGKREREEPKSEFKDKKIKEEPTVPTIAQIIDMEQVVGVKQEKKREREEVPEPLPALKVSKPADDDDQESEFELVFNSKMEILK